LLKLSHRLATLAQMVPVGARIADIGTDHAFLPCYLGQERISPFAIGVEVKKGPYQRACSTVEAFDQKEKVEIRLGDGLAVINPGEVDIVIIAGMGGAAICDILENSPQVVTLLDKLIIQPMKGAELVRYWLVKHGWLISEEEIIYEDKQYYQIIGAVQRKKLCHDSEDLVSSLDELEAVYGPILLKKRHPLLVCIVEKDINGWQDILDELAKSNKEEAQIRLKEFKEKHHRLKELKEWLLAANHCKDNGGV